MRRAMTTTATSVLIDAGSDEIEAAFRRELRWPQGHRVNLDSRLMLLGLKRLQAGLAWSEEAFRACAVVAGSRLGSMESYEAFDRSLTDGCPAPLAFAHALPSIPLACASLCFSLRGHVLTLMGGPEVGLTALEQAMALLRAGRASHAIAGCWEVPSETSAHRYPDDGRCRLLLVALDYRSVERFGTMAIGSVSAADADTDADAGPVARLWRHLADTHPECAAEPVHE